MKPTYLLLVLLAVIAIACADIFLKQASKSGDFILTLQSPWFWGGVSLYLFQIVAFTYLFVSKVELTIVGIIQITLYAAIVLSAGYFIYKETLTLTQYIGVGLALAGVLLIQI